MWSDQKYPIFAQQCDDALFDILDSSFFFFLLSAYRLGAAVAC